MITAFFSLAFLGSRYGGSRCNGNYVNKFGTLLRIRHFLIFSRTLSSVFLLLYKNDPQQPKCKHFASYYKMDFSQDMTKQLTKLFKMFVFTK